MFPLHDHLGLVRHWLDAYSQPGSILSYGPLGEPVDPVPGEALTPGYAGLFLDPVAGLALTARRA